MNHQFPIVTDLQLHNHIYMLFEIQTNIKVYLKMISTIVIDDKGDWYWHWKQTVFTFNMVALFIVVVTLWNKFSNLFLWIAIIERKTPLILTAIIVLAKLVCFYFLKQTAQPNDYFLR